MCPGSGLTWDIEAHYRTLLYDLDLVAYNNCVFDGDVLSFRKSIVSMAEALVSVAMIDPSRSREAAYNLNLVAKNVDHPYLTDDPNCFNSNPLRMVHQALVCGLYHLESGRNTYDVKMKSACDWIVDTMQRNDVSKQHVLAVETISGRYDMFTNLLALLALKVADIVWGTDHTELTDRVLDGLLPNLQDPETGLFYDYYQTGAFGFQLEEFAESAFWTLKAVSPAQNALVLSIYHLFRPEDAERAWDGYKKRFGEELAALEGADLAGCVCMSYYTELGGNLEALFAARLCAREMGDETFFRVLQDRVDALMEPKHVETKIVYEGLPEDERATAVYFGLLSQCHMGWAQILSYDWAAHRDEDFSRVR